MATGIWQSRSRPGRQTLLAVVCVAAGILLAFGFRGFHGFGSNEFAGFMLGVLLLAIGAAGLLTGGSQTVVVDPGSRRITVQESGPIPRKKVIPFGEVTEVHMGYLGKRSNFVTCYFLVLNLRGGGEYPLFSPGRFYEGSSDRSVVEGWKLRLEEYLSR